LPYGVIVGDDGRELERDNACVGAGCRDGTQRQVTRGGVGERQAAAADGETDVTGDDQLDAAALAQSDGRHEVERHERRLLVHLHVVHLQCQPPHCPSSSSVIRTRESSTG